jgi:hypothetical protein
MNFNLKSACNPVLALGVRKVEVVMTVTADGAESGGKSSAKKAVVLVLDDSGSTNEPADSNQRRGPSRLDVAKPAMTEAINALDEDCLFGVIAFNSTARVVSSMVLATPSNKRRAIEAVQNITPGGGTSMARALMGVLHEVNRLEDYIKYVLFVTDGENGDDDRDMENALKECEGKFQCSCWGIGTDWKGKDLTKIADRLLGRAEAAPEISKLKDYFVKTLGEIMSKGSADIKLRVQGPKSSILKSAKQVDPTIVELTGLIKSFDDKQKDIPLGAWGNETRKYLVEFDLEPQPDGGQMMVCMPKIANGDEVTSFDRIVVQWSSNENLTALMDPEVAHYTGQGELAKAIKDGLEAKKNMDFEQATVLLGRAVQIAAQTGNEGATVLLKRVVDIDNAEQGTIRVKRTVDKAADLELEMGGTITVRRRA